MIPIKQQVTACVMQEVIASPVVPGGNGLHNIAGKWLFRPVGSHVWTTCINRGHKPQSNNRLKGPPPISHIGCACVWPHKIHNVHIKPAATSGCIPPRDRAPRSCLGFNESIINFKTPKSTNALRASSSCAANAPKTWMHFLTTIEIPL